MGSCHNLNETLGSFLFLAVDIPDQVPQMEYFLYVFILPPSGKEPRKCGWPVLLFTAFKEDQFDFSLLVEWGGNSSRRLTGVKFDKHHHPMVRQSTTMFI